MVANADSITLVVRRWVQCAAGKFAVVCQAGGVVILLDLLTKIANTQLSSSQKDLHEEKSPASSKK